MKKHLNLNSRKRSTGSGGRIAPAVAERKGIIVTPSLHCKPSTANSGRDKTMLAKTSTSVIQGNMVYLDTDVSECTGRLNMGMRIGKPK